jgi:hypothetical protein
MMFRSLLPFILASLGSFIILFATSIVLFEWQTGEVVTDFPSAYEVHILPSPWITRLGDSLDDNNFISLGKIYVSKDGKSCNHKDINIVVNRSENDKTLERLSLNFTEKRSQWLYVWGARLLILSGMYIWWYIIFCEHRSFILAIVSTMIAAVFYLGLTQVLRPFLSRVVPIEYLGMLDCYHGTVTLIAKMGKIHYETIILFLAGIIMQLGALIIMIRQIIGAMGKKKGSKE